MSAADRLKQQAAERVRAKSGKEAATPAQPIATDGGHAPKRGWTADKAEHARRLAICEECETVRVQVVGFCKRCRRPFNQAIQHDDEVVCRCGGEIHVIKDFARCGTGRRQPDGKKLGCGCPLASRIYANCPQGKW